MKCAIVALIKESKKNFFSDIFKTNRRTINEVEIIHATHPVTIYTIGYDAGRICEFKEKKVNKIIAKCIKELRGRNVQSVYLTDEVADFMPCDKFFSYFKVATGQRVFDTLLNDAISICASEKKIDSIECRAGIWQENFDERGYRIVQNICDKFKYITLYTVSVESAKCWADKLYAQTGLSVKVSKKLAKINSCDFIIALDKLAPSFAYENSIVIDESSLCEFRCKNAIEFSIPFGFNTLMNYFVIADQRCVEFLFDCCDIDINLTKIHEAMDLMGCSTKKVLYKSHKNIDKKYG